MTAPSKPVVGLMWMVLTGILFVAVTAIVKHLDDRVPAPQAAFLRYVIGLVFLLPLWRQIAGAPLDMRHLRLYAGRGVLHAVGVSLWFFAMTRIPIAEVTALNYLSPIYITLGAALFLGERFSWPRMLAILTSLLGVALILRPGFREVDLGHLAMLGTALLFAGSYLIAKVLSNEVSPTVVVAMLSIWTTIGLAPMAMSVWIWPSWDDLGWLFLVACFATAGHFTMTLAFQSAPISVTQPITFLQLVWAALLGLLVFAEGIDGFVMLGGAVILASVVVISLREAQAKRRVAVG